MNWLQEDAAMLQWLKNALFSIVQIIKAISFIDFIDILCVAVILYFIYKFIRERRAGKLSLGVISVFAVLLISDLLEMHAMQYIFKNVFQVGVITLVILFQPELRSMLEKMGGESLWRIKSIGEQHSPEKLQLAINEVCAAASEMSAAKTGALIVFERSTMLGEYIMTGTVINAQPSSFLIRNIFFNKAPLHDGALIIRDGRLHAAGCVLPLSSNENLAKTLGTRHRAAVGLSENSDAVMVVVSEETGTISIACDGILSRGYNAVTLKDKLGELFAKDLENDSDGIKKRFFKVKSKSQIKSAKSGKGEE